MKSLLSFLQSYYRHATDAEKEIITYWLQHPERSSHLNIRELASETYTSTASIIRLCQKLDFEGYKEFRSTLIYEVAVRERENHRQIEDLKKEDNIESIIEKVTFRNITSLKSTAESLSPKLISDCLELMQQARAIHLFGMGTSLLAARDLYLKMMRINKLCLIHDEWHVQFLMAKNIGPQDLAILFSYSGMTHEMIRCAQTIKESGGKLISVCGFEKSTIAKLADYNLGVVTNEHIFRSGAMSSRIAQLNVVDILFNGFINKNYESSLKQVSKTHISKEDEVENGIILEQNDRGKERGE